MPWRLIAAGVLLAGVAAWHVNAVRSARSEGRAEIQAVLDAERIASKAAAESQAEANRLAAQSAKEQAARREADLNNRLKGMRRELWTATENLATCRVSSDAIGMLNRARAAGEDQPATGRTK